MTVESHHLSLVKGPEPKPWVIEAGVNVVDKPFVAHGNVATAGGCLASQYLATWMIARGATLQDAEEAMHYVAPVGEKALYVEQALAVVTTYLPKENVIAACRRSSHHASP